MFYDYFCTGVQSSHIDVYTVVYLQCICLVQIGHCVANLTGIAMADKPLSAHLLLSYITGMQVLAQYSDCFSNFLAVSGFRFCLRNERLVLFADISIPCTGILLTFLSPVVIRGCVLLGLKEQVCQVNNGRLVQLYGLVL